MEEEESQDFRIPEVFVGPLGLVSFTPHSLEQAMLRFGCQSLEEAEVLLLDRLAHAGFSRRRPNGAVRWTAGTAQIVTVEKEGVMLVITCYPTPLHRLLHAAKKRRWGKHKHLLKAACRGVNHD